MCELFGMSCHVPAAVTFSLEALAIHGNSDGPNHDGWGIAYYDGHDARIIKEAGSASESPLMRFVEQAHGASTTVIAHIRHATEGGNALKNTHPFTRELGGRAHCFAHNGELPAVFDAPRFQSGRARPIGETDSEHAFCALLERLAALWSGDEVPSLESRLEVVAEFAADLCALSPLSAANFLYSDSVTLFAHSHRRRRGPGAPFKPPGLHKLVRTCTSEPRLLHSPGVEVTSVESGQQVTLLASVPLTAEDWQPLAEGTLVALEEGQLVAETTVD